jgi:antitoxin component of RelBE/YafQ-DinJ toxin-antitoxin module
MAADAFIQIRVTPEIKARLKALAEREGKTESAVVRGLLTSMLRVQDHAADLKSSEAAPILRDSRLYVRLRLEDRKLLRARSLAREIPSATYVALLVRSHLHRVTPTPEAELPAVRQSVTELRAFGRSLKVLARGYRARARAPGLGSRTCCE